MKANIIMQSQLPEMLDIYMLVAALKLFVLIFFHVCWRITQCMYLLNFLKMLME